MVFAFLVWNRADFDKEHVLFLLLFSKCDKLRRNAPSYTTSHINLTISSSRTITGILKPGNSESAIFGLPALLIWHVLL